MLYSVKLLKLPMQQHPTNGIFVGLVSNKYCKYLINLEFPILNCSSQEPLVLTLDCAN
ncbi:asr1257 [Nostoc sp. PCC 7120 = FACHB-418]|nr:asr1257 [Nostoc sp. PCC 7120 = FACHB-418]